VALRDGRHPRGELVQGGQVYLMASPKTVMPATQPGKGK
jgi:hypothetical protein